MLIRAQHHQDFVGFIEHDVFADHRPDMLPVEEGSCEGGQLDLNQWQAVDEDRHVVAILVAALDGDLLRDLIAVPQQIHRVEELQVNRFNDKSSARVL